MDKFEIKRASTTLWCYPLTTATGGSGITSVDVVVVDMETADGITGTGFSYVLGGGGAVVAAMARDMIERFVLGSQVTAPQVLWRRLVSSLNRLGRGPGYIAVAAIDVAAWDLHAKILGVPLCVALGGEPKAVPVYGSGGFGPTQEPGEAILQATRYVERGCQAIKLRFSGQPSDIERLEAVVDAIPDHVRVMADLNEKCDLLQATWLANECGEYNLMWLEEPLPTSDIAGYEALAASSPVPLATGEHHQGLVELTPFFERNCCTVVQPDLAMMGGITEAMRVATIADYYGLVVAPHFLPALFVHLAGAVPSVRWMEDFPLLEPLFDNPADMDKSGKILPPNEPGHGLKWADGARQEFAVSG